MGVYDVHETKSGVTIGFDDKLNDWVVVDRQALEGSTVGNIVRGAGRGLESIVQGIAQFDEDPQGIRRAQREELARRQEAASNVAPVAEGFGNVVPDIGAGVGLGLATGGLGLGPMLAAEAGLGAALGGIRPGSAAERAENAIWSSVAAVGGAVLGPAAVKGIGAALKVFGGVENRVLQRITETVDTSGAQLRQADEMATIQQGGSVGAARTPGGLVDDATAMENRLLETGDEVGADLMDLPRMQQMADRARELDMPVPLGFGSRAMSPARLGQAANEMNPFGDVLAKRTMNQQKARMSEFLSDALGVKPKQALFVDDLNDARTEIGNKFETVQKRLPNIDGAEVAKALESVGGGAPGLFGPMTGQKAIGGAIESAKLRPILSGEEFMNTRSRLSELMSDAFAQGHADSGEVLMTALNKLDEVAAKTLKRAGDEKTAKLWETARTQWRVLKMTEAPGAVNVGTGEINPLSLFNRMNKPKSRGGWKGDRPAAGSPARKLFDALEIGVASQTQVPMTGARALIRDAMQSTVGKTAVGGAAGSAAGLGIWDALN